jgi:hypothetical protein
MDESNNSNIFELENLDKKSDRKYSNYFEQTYRIADHKNEEANCCLISMKNYLKTKQKKLGKIKYYKNLLIKSVPLLDWLPKYNLKQNLLYDLVAGNTVGVMNIPQGMAYSMLGKIKFIYFFFFKKISKVF